jgi:hypothetical protein
LNRVAQHLLGDDIHPAHVFLKVEAFKGEAAVSVISDVDMRILDGERLAQYLHGFYADQCLVAQMANAGNVAAMHRWDSRVTFQDTPMRLRAPYGKKGLARSVSYCFAVIRPNPHLAERYCQLMAQSSREQRGATLSDQALLAEVLGSHYHEMNHNILCVAARCLKLGVQFGPPWRRHFRFVYNAVG